MNEQVDKIFFDNSKVLLKFPSADNIVDEISKQGDDVTIAKIDVVRSFRNLTL